MAPAVSVTLTVKVTVPAPVGVPLMVIVPAARLVLKAPDGQARATGTEAGHHKGCVRRGAAGDRDRLVVEHRGHG